MRHDPLFTLWAIECPSPEACSRLMQRLSAETASDAVFVDEARAFPGGVEACRIASHRLGDYFASVQILPEGPALVHLLFHRRESAGRFWKDLMARILQKIRLEGLTPTLEYRGDEDPSAVATSEIGK